MKIHFWNGTIVLFLCLLCGAVFSAELASPPKKNKGTLQKRTYRLKQNYPAPKPVDPVTLGARPAASRPKNIILVIGDGMGPGALRLASLHAHGRSGRLLMEQLPAVGLVRTASANRDVTDSAAAGTALSSGIKTDNRMIGMTPSRTVCRSIAEAAARSGRAVGILTTDSLTGATPAAFYAHVKNRNMETDIAAQSVLCGFELLIGNEHAKPFLPASAGGRRSDGRNLCTELKEKGYAQVATEKELERMKGDRKVFGFVSFPIRDPECLARVAGAAMKRLSADPEGFFLMVECSNPDWGGHHHQPDQSVAGVLMTDFVLQKALEFARKSGDTLVVVTADHETGGVAAAPNREDPKTPHLYYGTTEHTGVPVGIFAFGPGAEKFNGVMENTEIPRRFAEFWKLKIGPGIE